MFERDTAKYQQRQEEIISGLVEECVNGITKMDHPPNGEQPLYGEAEAMYFKAIRNFFENSISHRIMNKSHQVCYDSRKRGKR